MSKQDANSSEGWNSWQSNNMATCPSVGRFSNDQTASLHVKASVKFNDNDRNKSMAPFSNHGHHFQRPPSHTPSHTPSPQRPANDIVDLRTAPGTDWKVPSTCDICAMLRRIITAAARV